MPIPFPAEYVTNVTQFRTGKEHPGGYRTRGPTRP